MFFKDSVLGENEWHLPRSVSLSKDLTFTAPTLLSQKVLLFANPRQLHLPQPTYSLSTFTKSSRPGSLSYPPPIVLLNMVKTSGSAAR